MRSHHTITWVLALVTLGAWSGCTVATNVDQYTFVESPCPHSAQRCSGGDTYWFIINDGDIARHMDEVLDGFDIDGTADPVCDHPDAISPDMTPGIDNALSPLLEAIEPSLPVGLHTNTVNAILTGESLVIIRLQNVDDFANDDCIELSVLRGQVPVGETASTYLDADGDGALDANLMLDFGTVTARDDHACISGGTFHAAYGDTRTLFNSGADVAELESAAGQMRCTISPTGITDGIQGGALGVDDIVELLDVGDQPGLVNVLRGAADLYPGRHGKCSHLSYALLFEGIPFTPGVFR